MVGSQSFARQIVRMMELTSVEIWFDDINTRGFDGHKVEEHGGFETRHRRRGGE